MGAVSDWINMGHTGRMRAWVFAMAIAMAGVVVLEATGIAPLTADTFPPYRSASFAWLRYLVGGFLFGIGMTLGSGCGNRTLVRIGGGNVKSLTVLASAALCAYLMMWTPLYARAFLPWIQATSIDLARHGVPTQEVGTLLAGMFGMEPKRAFSLTAAGLTATALFVWVLKSPHFRDERDHILGGAVVGLAVLAGWFITAGPMGRAWKEYAEFAAEIPSRVQPQSFTFISPMGDGVRYLSEPANFTLINFGIVALTGVILGSLLHALAARDFHYERFLTLKDFGNHVLGGALMGTGGVLAMGCTIGQAVTGVSTFSAGSILAFLAIVSGAAATMKWQYWRMMREA
jgi:uncharacterized membrane protein YedE/YeeE